MDRYRPMIGIKRQEIPATVQRLTGRRLAALMGRKDLQISFDDF